jgi:hypothetical protein
MSMSVLILAMLRSEHMLSHMVLNPLIPSEFSKLYVKLIPRSGRRHLLWNINICPHN